MSEETKELKNQPLYDGTLIKPIKHDEYKTLGGIIMKEPPNPNTVMGEVHTVGLGQYTDAGVLLPTLLKKGDIVLYGSNTFAEVKLEGVDYHLIQETKVLMIIERKAK